MNIEASDPRAVAVVAAIQGGDVGRLTQLLREHGDLATARIVDAGGTSRTLLHVAADWPGHFPKGAETVAALVAAGADVDARVIQGNPALAPETALHWAASSDDVAVLDALLDGGADIEAPGAVFTDGAPMSDAVVFAQWKAARRLLERGARTTIWQAAALGLVERVKECCGESAAAAAASSAQSAQSAPPRDQITNALWHACRGGQRETAEYLLGLGADLNWVGHDRKTPLQVAVESGAQELVEWLRARGGQVSGRADADGLPR